MRSKRLLWQLFPSYIIIALISVIAVTWFASRSLRSFLLSNAALDLEARARLVHEHVRDVLDVGDYARVDSLCDRLGRQSGTRVTVILPDGLVVGDSHGVTGARLDTGRPEMETALAGGVGVSTRRGTDTDGRMMYVAIAAGDEVRPAAVVRVAIPVTVVDAALRAAYGRIALSGLLIAVLAAVISLFISRRIARPLEELKMGADRFASGDFDRRLAVPDTEEIGALAEAMNKMAEQLSDRIAALVQQKTQEDAILGSMVESVLAVDAQGRLITANHAAGELFDVDFSQKEGETLQGVIRHHQMHEVVERTLESDEAIEDEITLYNPEEQFLQVHGSALRSANGESLGALLVLNDITRLRRLEQVRRDFVANVSHELKTPITTIKGFVETLLGGAINDDKDARRFLNIVARHTERLNAIIEDLLALSRIEQESEQDKIVVEPIRVYNVVRQAVDACRAGAQSRNIRVTLSGDDTLECQMNGPLVEQAVVNLIDNAIKYSDEGGAVEITTERAQNGSLAIRVRDHGCGVEEEHLPRLFERFYRTDKARSRAMGGTGLGLAIVKHIALAHGGRVEVRSRVGEGSTFSIYLPLN